MLLRPFFIGLVLIGCKSAGHPQGVPYGTGAVVGIPFTGIHGFR